MNTLYRALPSVDICLTALAVYEDVASCPRLLLRQAVTHFLDTQRTRIAALNDAHTAQPEHFTLAALLPELLHCTRRMALPRLRRVLNATGVVIHTNMGRSILPEEARAAVALAAQGYSNLELDLETGGRGSRSQLTEWLLCQLTGAEAALVVNNNAAAVLLTLDSLCKGGEVLVARGQLVEIGGSFRIPEVMEKSGALLREVGATNRVHVQDYERAITPATVALLRVHTSNYRIVGFHKDVPLATLVQLGQAHGLPVIEDLGSGSLMDMTPYGLPDEPTVQAVVQAGADVVTFSGDKVLGGPQAGIIVGKAHYIDQLRRNPLHRALRSDKLTLAALEATLRLYADPAVAVQRVPTLRMMTATPDELARRARALQRRLRTAAEHIRCTLRKDVSRVGGGSFPEHDLPTTLVCLHPTCISVTELKARLLTTSPPLLGRLEDDAFCLDVRTLTDKEFTLICDALDQVFT